MTKVQRKIIAELGPYTMDMNGIMHDGNGFSLAFSFRVNPSSEECDWDRAVVAALNEICKTEKTTGSSR